MHLTPTQREAAPDWGRSLLSTIALLCIWMTRITQALLWSLILQQSCHVVIFTVNFNSF